MNSRSTPVRITRVGPSSDPRVAGVNRGVFNFDSLVDYLAQQAYGSVNEVGHEIIVDLSRVGWVGLFDWWCFTSLLHATLEKNPNLKISLDFIGDSSGGLIPYHECSAYINRELSAYKYSPRAYDDSYVVHRVLNFISVLEAVEGFWNVAGGRVVLRHVSREHALHLGWYRRSPEIEDSVFLPRTSVSAKEMCVLFATRQQIEVWRRGMAEKRVPEAAVFHSEEFWRILCHELARNVFEHAMGPGFVTARIVLPVNGAIPRWCRDVYGSVELDSLQSTKEAGFLELCVCDAGRGIPATIVEAYKNRYAERHPSSAPPSEPRDEELLKFAFDELGTSKDAEHSWLTDRHALGHILFVVRKYGGTLAVRSGRAALVYRPADVAFGRCTTQLGYEPQEVRAINPAIPGTHIQALIPLVPLPRTTTGVKGSVLTRHLPTSFLPDLSHPVGPLVPVRDKLEAFQTCIAGDTVAKFQGACRALADSLLLGAHPREEPMVFDLAELDWTPAQFETFLYLFQNVLVGRPVLFTNVPHTFAELVIGQEEDPEIPTYLPKEMQDKIQKRVLEREFADGRFLETYSSLGAVVLGLGPDKGEYLFGIRNRELRRALLEIVHGEWQKVSGLAESGCAT